MLDQIHSKNLFVTFPDESKDVPLSKSQLKKQAKVQAAKEKKSQKKEAPSSQST